MLVKIKKYFWVGIVQNSFLQVHNTTKNTKFTLLIIKHSSQIIQNMKKIIILIFLFLVNQSYSQEGIVIQLNYDNILNVVNGTYLKDIENKLDPYVGTWETTWQNKTFTLIINKIIHHPYYSGNGDYYYIDELIGKFKVIDSNGNIIVNYQNTLNPDLSKLSSVTYPLNNKIEFAYYDVDFCEISGIVTLNLDDLNPKIVHYEYGYEEFWLTHNCKYYDVGEIPIPIPTVAVILSKI